MEKVVLLAALLILISLASTSKLMPRYIGSCGYGWALFENSCYKITRRKHSWLEARYRCKAEDLRSYLVNIGSQRENEFLVNMARQQGVTVWIGLNDIGQEGRFVWDNTNQEPTYKSWASKEPNNYQGGEDCVILYHAYGSFWYDVRCGNLNYGMCEKSLH